MQYRRYLPKDVQPYARAYGVFREAAFLSIFAVPIVLALAAIFVSVTR